MLNLNQVLIDRLIDFPSATASDRSVGAHVYNQIGECLLRYEEYSKTYIDDHKGKRI